MITEALSKDQRQQYIARENAKYNEFLGVKETMNQNQRYEAIYQADLKAMGGVLSVSKEDYIASLKATDNYGMIDLSNTGNHSGSDTATLSAVGPSPSPGDEKYRKQYRADLAAMGGQLGCTEEEYIASLKVTDNGGELSLC